MDPEFPSRVYFDDFNPDSFNIRVIYWYTPHDYWNFLAFSEKINVAIMSAFEQQAIQFALPLKVTYADAASEPPSPQDTPAADQR